MAKKKTDKEALKEYYDLQTCSDKRLVKMKNILKNARKEIGKDLTCLTITDITKFLKYVNDSSYANWTKNDYKKIFKAFVKYQYRKKFLDWELNPQFRDGFKGVSKQRAFNRQKINKSTLVKPEELEKLLRAAASLKWKALLMLLLESAFRPCELVNLRWKDFSPEESKGVWVMTTLSPKTGNSRSILIKDSIVHLKRWREEFQFLNRTDDDFVFPSPFDRNKHLSSAGTGVYVKRLCSKAGIRNLYPYLFRHSRLYSVQKKMGARMSSKFGGHSLETSELYNHLDDDDLQEEMLSKIYPTEEITVDKRNDYEKEIDELKRVLYFVAKKLLDKNEFETIRVKLGH